MAAAVVAGGLLAGGCGERAEGPAASPTVRLGAAEVAASTVTGLVPALCQAAAKVGADPGRAGATFYARAHDVLHTLAAALGEGHRDLQAGLLEAKARVEEALAAPGAPGAGEALVSLAGAAERGLAALALTEGPRSCG